MTVTEIVWFPLQRAADESLKESVIFPGRQPGFCGQASGRKLGDESETFVWFIDWETLEDHHAFMRQPEDYPALHKSFEGKMLAPPEMMHVAFKPRSPTTDPDASELRDVWTVTLKTPGKVPVVQSGLGLSWGVAMEDARVLYIVSSVDALVPTNTTELPGIRQEDRDLVESFTGYRVELKLWPEVSLL